MCYNGTETAGNIVLKFLTLAMIKSPFLIHFFFSCARYIFCTIVCTSSVYIIIMILFLFQQNIDKLQFFAYCLQYFAHIKKLYSYKYYLLHKTLTINPQTLWNTGIFARVQAEFTTNLLLLRKKPWCAVKTLADKRILPQIRKTCYGNQN